jgi:hypothetical protein
MGARVSRLENDMRDAKAARSRMEAAIIRIEATLAATLPHLAAKADIADLRTGMKSNIARLDVALAEKPDKACLWGILALRMTAYAGGLAGLDVLK